MTNQQVVFILLLHFIGCNIVSGQDEVYLFSYFKGNGQSGLHLAYSVDARNWKTLHNDSSFFKPTIGDSLLRDPSIVLDEKGVFHMVWTTGWWNNGFGYASSTDLKTWTNQTYVQPMVHEPTTKNNWAPELFYDKKKKEYIILWSAWIPGRYPKTDSLGSVFEADPQKPRKSHRIYASYTKDFKKFTKAKLFYEPGFNVIDASMIKIKNEYILFCKDETLIPPQKNIKIAYSKNAKGPYSKASKPITGNFWAEGPTSIMKNDTCFVYFDKYKDHTYGAIYSTDFKNWVDISHELTYPLGMRHGTVFRIPRRFLHKLLQE